MNNLVSIVKWKYDDVDKTMHEVLDVIPLSDSILTDSDVCKWVNKYYDPKDTEPIMHIKVSRVKEMTSDLLKPVNESIFPQIQLIIRDKRLTKLLEK